MARHIDLASTTEADLKIGGPGGKSVLTTDAQFLLVEGCECSVNGSNTQYLDLTSGKAIVDVQGVRYVVTPAAFTKRLNAAWAIGTNAGGLLTGSSFPASTTLHCYIMRRRSDGTVDHGFHTSATQSTFTDGSSNVWDLRLHMSITTQSSSIRPIKQNGGLVQYLTPVTDITAVIGTTASLYTLSVVTGIKVRPLCKAHLGTQASSGYTFYYFSDPDCVDIAPDSSTQSGNTGAFMVGAYLYTTAAPIEYIYCNTSAQIRGRASATASNTIITTFGYIHPRGGNPTAAQTVVLNAGTVRSTFSDANYTVTAGTTIAAQTGTMSAARTVTLPAANAVIAGFQLLVIDEAGSVTTTNSLSISAAGSDTINELTSLPALINNASSSVILESDGTSNWTVVKSSPCIFEFTSSGSFNFPNNNFKLIRELLTGGGGGGGGGRRDATSTAKAGGGGGAAGSVIDTIVNAVDLLALGLTMTVTIGAAGTAGNAAASDTANGGNGGTGGTTSLSISGTTIGQAPGGNGGTGGTTSTGTPGAALNSTSAQWIGGGGGTGNATSAGQNGSSHAYAPGSGGGGGGVNASNVAQAGGAGTVGSRAAHGTTTGGTAGTSGTSGGNGGAGSVINNTWGGGGGAGGGGGSSGTGGAGGSGARGGGGGGGGASLNGNASGGGGAGGAGFARIVFF
ncbi:MAG: hypothetical protein KME45_03550 [Stenomitos rutilans HA7619-LM2]|nr:hypothetical protein [Stenomitos rutilans HA7619-LM2]MBW4469461.1 hypothetical protein [Stenomitos rutilans HA7619-LM2]